jgi:hypothetical protein
MRVQQSTETYTRGMKANTKLYVLSLSTLQLIDSIPWPQPRIRTHSVEFQTHLQRSNKVSIRVTQMGFFGGKTIDKNVVSTFLCNAQCCTKETILYCTLHCDTSCVMYLRVQRCNVSSQVDCLPAVRIGSPHKHPPPLCLCAFLCD